MDTTNTPPGALPDLRGQSLVDCAPSGIVILKRVGKKSDVSPPVAAFGSSI